jgi:glycosyltransferase involved in cell wall biosynthesis
VTGLVIAPGDSRTLAQAVNRLLDDPALRARLGTAGRGAVGAYNYEAMVEGFDRAISTALPGSHPRSADHRSDGP